MKVKMIYLDDAATTQTKKEVVKEMISYFSEDYGNPSSEHELGERARKAIDNARERIAKEIGARAWEIYFTSGTTESNNLALFGLARKNKNRKKRKIIISCIEHASIIEPCEFLKKEGFEVIKIPVDDQGLVDLDFLRKNIDRRTLVVSVMHVNNVIGTIQDIKEIGKICREREVLFHTDAAQSFSKIKIDVRDMYIDLLSAGAHKIGGPKGVGFLYIRDGVEKQIESLIFGGGQEKDLRGGTENVPAILGFAKAVEISNKNKININEVRDYLIKELEEIGAKINGSKKESERIFNNVHFSLGGFDSRDIVAKLSHLGIYLSSGSACESKREKEDHVLRAIGLNKREIDGAIRVTLNDKVGKKEIDYFIQVLKEIVRSRL